MIPANAFTVTPVFSNFKPPYDRPYDPLSQTVLGGTAIGDGSDGREVQNWVVTYNSPNIEVKTEGGPVVFTLAAPDAITVSLAFDNNMGIVLAWKTHNGAKLYYYDTTASQYITRGFLGPTSCRVVVDDTRLVNGANSDVIFGYTMNGNLYWRQQRDRYDIERAAGSTTKLLRRMGPSVTNRLQFELL